MITLEQLNEICGDNMYQGRRAAFLEFLQDHGGSLNQPHRLALILCQVLHECKGFRYVKEVWGPTAAQRRYEGRRDLGNVQKGDGKRFMGRLEIQVTGRHNYRALTEWCARVGISAPNFEDNPQELENVKWVGLGTVWYFKTRVENRFMDAGNIEMVTRRVNGGLNGYEDRLRYYDRAALVILGRASVRDFQGSAGIAVDGVSGPQTREAMHKALYVLKPQPHQPVSFWGELFKALAGIFKGK